MKPAASPRLVFNPAAIVLCLLWMLLNPALSLAGGIVVITRDDIVPYDIFLKAFVQSASQSTMQIGDARIFSVQGLSDAEEQKIIARIVASKPALLLAVGSGALRFARAYFSRIPCVCAMVVNPGLLQLADGSDTACISMEVSPRQKLAMLKRILPGVRRVGVVYDPQQCADQVQQVQQAASRLGLAVDARPVSSTKMAMHAFENIITEVDVLLMLYDKTVLAPQSLQHMYTLSFRYKVPVVGISEKYVRLGALFSLDVDITDLGLKARDWVLRCMHGAAPCMGLHYLDAQAKLYFNATLAPKMNITVPENVLQKAVIVE